VFAALHKLHTELTTKVSLPRSLQHNHYVKALFTKKSRIRSMRPVPMGIQHRSNDMTLAFSET
jgi:hypothetical protein